MFIYNCKNQMNKMSFLLRVGYIPEHNWTAEAL